MKRTAILLLLTALAGCRDDSVCAGVVGTCLSVRLQSSANLGERIDAVQFEVEGDGTFRYNHHHRTEIGGQLLPLTVPLPLPDEAQRTIKVNAQGLWNGRPLLYGSRVVSSLSPGDRRSIVLTLMPLGGDNARCDDGVQNGVETGVDCGGPCPPCGPSCTDRIRNGDETDVDCGGSCSPCLGGQACLRGPDCSSGRCEGNTCVRAFGLSSVTPDGGPTTGGTQVTLQGELLSSDMEVFFGTTPAPLIRVEADGRTAVVTAPPGRAGPVTLRLRRGGETLERPGAYAYHYGTLRFGGMPRITYAPGNKPYYIVSGHFNGLADPHLDIALINEIDSTVGLWLGRGDGTFLRGNVYRVGRMDGTYPLMLAVGDFNGDRRPDLVTADNRQPTVSVLVANEDGSFRPAVQYDVPAGAERAWPPAVATADFNGDGLDDVAVTDSMNGGRTYVLLAAADRSGNLTAALLVGGSDTGVRDADSTLTAGHIDGDSFPDLVVATSARRTARVFVGNGDGTFRSRGELALGGVGTYTLRLADLNGDGKSDLVSGNRGSDNISILLGNGDGTFRPVQTVRSGQGPFSLAIGDFDGDGRLDVAAACYREQRGSDAVVSLLLGDGRGGLPRSAEALTLPTVFGVTAGDYNGDGRLDLATVSVSPSNALTVLLNASM
ncbi:MAG: FG-GAP-like repeat-containing protein [Myxococcales bacterium]|nr:FG-GAP-like repeat-containing protein [Myxococcota bacterium]MDW8280979.1 FG-GAP-like repeat-containing protein [Myxococcales bacterium]